MLRTDAVIQYETSNVLLARVHLTYCTRSNLWNVLIIGTQDFNYLIRSNSWNKCLFEKTDHSNRSNEQFLPA